MGLVILLVMLAIYVSVGRMLSANLAGFRTEILQALNARMPFIIEARQFSGEWQSFTPVIVLSGLRLSIPGSSSPPLELSEGRISLDVLNSLRTRSLQMTRIVLTNLSMRGELSREGVLRLAGFEGGSGESVEPPGNTVAYFEGRLLQCRHCPRKRACMYTPESADPRKGKGRQASCVVSRTGKRTSATPFTDWMKGRVDSEHGKAIYGHRMSVVVPVFGNITRRTRA